MTPDLHVIDSCDGCGACCLVVTSPPFVREFDEHGEEAWERLKRDRPDLVDELLDEQRARRSRGEPSYGSPCLWFDSASRRCRHYELRPVACRRFEVGGEDCLDARRRAGLP